MFVLLYSRIKFCGYVVNGSHNHPELWLLCIVYEKFISISCTNIINQQLKLELYHWEKWSHWAIIISISVWITDRKTKTTEKWYGYGIQFDFMPLILYFEHLFQIGISNWFRETELIVADALRQLWHAVDRWIFYARFDASGHLNFKNIFVQKERHQLGQWFDSKCFFFFSLS